MASVSEILYQFQGDAQGLLGELRRLERRLKDLPEEEQVVIKAETDRALKDIAEFEAALKGLEQEEPEVTAKLNLRQLFGDIAKAQAALKTLPQERVVDIRIERLDIRRGVLEAQFKQIETRIEELKKARPQVEVDAKIDVATARLQQLEQRLVTLGKKKATPKVEADIRKAVADIDKVRVEIDALTAKNPQIKIDADIGKAEADLIRILGEVEALDKKKAEIKIDVDRHGVNEIAKAERSIRSLIGSVSNVGEAAGQAATPVLNLGAAFNAAGGFLRRLGPIITGLTIVLAASLLPAILAVGLGMAGAATGAGALAVAFGGILGPAVVGLIGIFGRLSAVMDAFKSRQQAQQAAQKGGAEAAQQALSAEVTLRNARRASGDASRAVEDAENSLAAARQQARQDIADGERALTDARHNQAEAVRSLAQAEVEAYRTIRDAIEAASDALRDYQTAKLDAAQAKLDVRQAKLDLQDLRKELGATGDEFSTVFKKFSDVNVDVSGLSAAIAKAGQGSAKGPLSVQDQIKLEQAVLNVRKARQRDKDAIDGVSDAARTLNDTTKEADRLRKTGIGGVESYRTAVQNLATANQAAADAQKNYNKLIGDGVKGAPGVVAAHDQLAGAMRNERRQAQDLRTAKKQLAGQETTAEKAMDAYRAKRKKLTDAEQGFLAAIIKFSAAWDKLWKSAAPPVLAALTSIVNTVTSLLPLITKPMQDLMGVWGDVLKSFAQGITTPKNIQNISVIFDGLKKVSTDFGTAATNAFNLLMNVAAAAMPLLEGLTADIADMTGKWAASTQDTGKLTDRLRPMVTAFKLFLGIAGAIGDVLVSAFSAASGPINEFLKWIRDGIRAFARWTKSAEGSSKIKKFFEDTLPLAKSIIKFIVKLGSVLLKAFQFVAPMLKPIVDSFSFLLDIIGFFLDILLKIPTPIRTVIGWLAGFFIGFGKITKGIQLFTKGLEGFPSLFAAVVSVGKTFINTLRRPFQNFFGALARLFRAAPVRKAFEGFVGGLKGIVSKVGGILGAPFRAVWSVIRGFFRSGVSAVGRILGGLADVFKKVLGKLSSFVGPLKKIWGDIKQGIKDAFSGLANFVKGVFDRIWRAIKTIINFVIRGVNVLIQGLNKLHFKIPDWVPGVGGKEFGVNIPEIPELAKGGIATGQVVAMIGEAGREAVLPLNASVYRELARGITTAMQDMIPRAVQPRMATNTGTINRYSTNVAKIEVAAPAGAPLDPVAAAVKMARVLERRGGGSRN